jgi:protein tyrosine/serine phosphatase
MAARLQVSEKDLTQMTSGTPAEPERHILLEGQTNFRDLGGYQTRDGRTVKWRQLYRSGRLANLTDMDVARLEELGIHTVVNLLTADDIEAEAV